MIQIYPLWCGIIQMESFDIGFIWYNNFIMYHVSIYYFLWLNINSIMWVYHFLFKLQRYFSYFLLWLEIPLRKLEIPREHFMQVQFSSAAQSCPTLFDPMNRSTPGLPVHHQLPEFTQTHVHRVRYAIQPSHPLSSPSPPAPNPSQHQGLFQWVSSSHEVAKVLEFQL